MCFTPVLILYFWSPPHINWRVPSLVSSGKFRLIPLVFSKFGQTLNTMRPPLQHGRGTLLQLLALPEARGCLSLVLFRAFNGPAGVLVLPLSVANVPSSWPPCTDSWAWQPPGKAGRAWLWRVEADGRRQNGAGGGGTGQSGPGRGVCVMLGSGP